MEHHIKLYLNDTIINYKKFVFNGGEAFSLKIFTNLINNLNFDKIYTVDPHSGVSDALLENVNVVTALDMISQGDKWDVQSNLDEVIRAGNYLFVSPDAGANKKTFELAKEYGHEKFIRADKLRDMATGNIKETVLYSGDLKGQDVIIADDICDGAATFCFLAKELRKQNAGKIILYVTHGIFSKGIDVIFEAGIDEIYTTDSFRKFPEIRNTKFHVLEMERVYGI